MVITLACHARVMGSIPIQGANFFGLTNRQKNHSVKRDEEDAKIRRINSVCITRLKQG